MAHSASTGAAKRTVNVVGKRLGIKRFGGQIVNAGTIVLRQRGSEFYPGKNAAQGRDFTIYSKIKGVVSFRRMVGYKRIKKLVDITPIEVSNVPVLEPKAPKTKEVVTIEASAKPAKKATAKTTPKKTAK